MKLAENDGQQQVDTTIGATDDQAGGETLQSGNEGDATGDTTDDAEEVVVTIGDESPPSEEEEQYREAPEWVRAVRKESKAKDRKIRELEQKLATAAPAAQQAAPVEVVKPTLESCDFDEDVFAEQLITWQETKRQADEKQRKEADAAKAKDEQFKTKLNAYNTAKTTSKVTDFEEAEAVVSGLLSPAQQGVLINCAKAPVHVVAALGKNTAEAAKLASITDLAQFAYALAELETKLKVTGRKAPPPPEDVVRGSAPVSAGAGDAKLAALEAEADRTGDRSKIAAYRRAQRQAA